MKKILSSIASGFEFLRAGMWDEYPTPKPEQVTKVKPRAGATVLSLANALDAVSQVMTSGHDLHGGPWEGGRLTDPDCVEKCNDSLMRHLLAEGRGEVIDDGEGGTGLPHAACTAANALIRLERMLRDGDA